MGSSSPRPEGLSNILNSIPSNFQPGSSPSIIGQTIGVISGENLPTPVQYNRANKVIGAIIYAEVNTNGPLQISGSLTDTDYNKYDIAYPVSFHTSHIPLEGELVWIKKDFPSANSKINKTAIKSCYLNVIGTWNSIQQNSVAGNNNWVDFIQNPNVKSLLPFQGDHIIQGRQGAGLRFSSTSKVFSHLNEWSSIGKGTDPITILTNGFAFSPNKPNSYVEQINKDLSSVYLTSAQSIPLQTDKNGILNNLTNPIDVAKYSSAQVIINSDRIVLNSKQDEVMVFAKTNIELNTKNVINLNADERVHLNTNAVFLGKYNETTSLQPLVLGNNIYTLLNTLLDGLYQLSTDLQSVVGSPEGAPAVDINAAGSSLSNSLDSVINQLGNVLSTHNFTT